VLKTHVVRYVEDGDYPNPLPPPPFGLTVSTGERNTYLGMTSADTYLQITRYHNVPMTDNNWLIIKHKKIIFNIMFKKQPVMGQFSLRSSESVLPSINREGEYRAERTHGRIKLVYVDEQGLLYITM
jgi:hypothetical protein